jgi:hypothetical protein
VENTFEPNTLAFSEETATSLAIKLEELEQTLSGTHRQILHAMIYTLLDPLDRLALRSEIAFSDEEQRSINEIEKELPGARD